MASYLKLPFQPQLLMQQHEHPTVTLVESVAQKLHLLTTTYLGECKFDESFGCPIWDADFENITTVNVWRDKTAKAVEEVFKQHEPRLVNTKVTIQLTQEELNSGDQRNISTMKRKIELRAAATLLATNENFDFATVFFLSPIAFD